MRLALFGDTGGHYFHLIESLVDLGVNVETATMPKDLKIVHVGDLIHKGPKSSQVLMLVDRLMTNNPGQWIQIYGNHEAEHINPGEAPFFWSCECTDEDKAMLQRWYDEGLIRVAWGTDDLYASQLANYPVNTPRFKAIEEMQKEPLRESLLVVHAGLTAYWYDELLNSPAGAQETAESLWRVPYNLLNQPGQLLGYNNEKVGPVWAIGNCEVYPSWEERRVKTGEGLPFHMVHGHTSSVKWSAVRASAKRLKAKYENTSQTNREYKTIEGKHLPTYPWFAGSHKFFRETTLLDYGNNAVLTPIGQNYLLGIDPGFSKNVDSVHTMQPYSLFELAAD